MATVNGNIYTEDNEFHYGSVSYENGLITDVSVQGETREGEDMVFPGLVDVHVHGAGGYDFSDGVSSSIIGMGRYEASHGVTAMLPTTVTLLKDELLDVMEAAHLYTGFWDGVKADQADFLGIHLEGPFLSAAKKGSHNADYLMYPDLELVSLLQHGSSNLIRMITLAPELHGAMDFIKSLKAGNCGSIYGPIIISIGHSMADYSVSCEAFSNGVSHVTHIYNAMPGYQGRLPGIIGATIDNKDVYVELIADGVHHHESVDRNAFEIFGDDRLVLISDSMRACGLEDGDYDFGGNMIKVSTTTRNGFTIRKAIMADGTIAASVANLYDVLRHCINDLCVPPQRVIKCATINPAKSIGADDKVGSIKVGRQADILIASPKDYELKQVILRGNEL